MTHDHEVVAAYVAGELTGTPHSEFETHLLTCEECWTEVQQGRRGRQLATLARESAPDALRDRITALTAGPPRRRWRISPVIAVAAAACVALIAVAVVVALRLGGPEPISAAVAAYRAQRLPGAQIPATAAPDLSKMGLSPTGAGAGDLAGIPATAYAYTDSTGRRLLIYVARTSFKTPANAAKYEGGDAWLSNNDGVVVLCSRAPHNTLVIGEDEDQVTDTAEYLDLT